MLALKLATCMTENSESFCHAAAQFIENRTRIRTEYIANVPWQDRERLFDSGEIDILWLYGLPYVDKADSRESGVELLAVPVPRGERYGGRPIYFSDVVVRRERKFATFFDLRGASWAYNEPRSHSGFNVIRAYLAEFRQFVGFFGMVIESGAHSVSLEMVMAARVDATAVDSTVLDWLSARHDDVARKLRLIETIGPGPIPPWVISRRLPERLCRDICHLLRGMHTEPFGRVMLDRAGIDHLVEVEDGDYNPIRSMVMKAAEVSLS